MALTNGTIGSTSPEFAGVAKPSYSWDQAARQITRDVSASYLPQFPSHLSLTYAYRATSEAPATPAGFTRWIGNGLDAIGAGGFKQFTATQIAGFDVWVKLIQDVANVTLTRVGSGTSGVSAYSDNAQILLGNYSTGAASTYAAGFGSYTFGIRNGVYSRAGYLSIDATESYNVAPSLENYGATVLLHEMMHVLGLSHPGDYRVSPGVRPTYAADATYAEDTRQYAAMSYFSEKETGADFGGLYSATPLLHDVAGLQRLYGANLTTRTGDTVYGFNSNAGAPSFTLTNNASSRVFTIWDAGGKDTLDLSGYATASQIDLREEAFSSAGSKPSGGRMVKNISIAKGAVIENAIGGGGNDMIVGNPSDNMLTGGGGDDVITGGGGNDTAVYSGARSQYQITQSGSKIIIRDLALNRDGTDTLTGVAFAQFADGRVSATPTYDPIGIAIADQLSVVYFGRGVSAEWRNATSTVVANGASPDLLKAFFNLAVTDRAFGASDSVQTLTNKTFNNIFGVNASAFEQNAWAATVANGYVTKETLPWAMFNSYLAATNVPPEYQVPAQSRIIAVNAFTNNLTGAAEAALGGPGAASAEAARAWLVPIRSQSDAYFKVQGAASSVLSIAGVKSGGPLESVEPAPPYVNDSLPLAGVTEGAIDLGL